MHNNALLLLKNCKKLLRAGGFTPDPLPSAAGGSAPRPLIPHWEFLTMSLLHTILLMLNIKQNCGYQHFKSFGRFDERNWVGAQDSSHY